MSEPTLQGGVGFRVGRRTPVRPDIAARTVGTGGSLRLDRAEPRAATGWGSIPSPNPAVTARRDGSGLPWSEGTLLTTQERSASPAPRDARRRPPDAGTAPRDGREIRVEKTREHATQSSLHPIQAGIDPTLLYVGGRPSSTVRAEDAPPGSPAGRSDLSRPPKPAACEERSPVLLRPGLPAGLDCTLRNSAPERATFGKAFVQPTGRFRKVGKAQRGRAGPSS